MRTPGIAQRAIPVSPEHTAVGPVTHAAPPLVRVPRALEIATVWGWRLLVVSAAAYLFAFLVLDRVQVVAVPLLLVVLVAGRSRKIRAGSEALSTLNTRAWASTEGTSQALMWVSTVRSLRNSRTGEGRVGQALRWPGRAPRAPLARDRRI